MGASGIRLQVKIYLSLTCNLKEACGQGERSNAWTPFLEHT